MEDVVFYHSLLHQFKDQLNHEFASLLHRLGEKREETTLRMLHTLKELARTVGAVGLAHIVAKIDRAYQMLEEIEPSAALNRAAEGFG